MSTTDVADFLADASPIVADYKRDRWDRPLIVPAAGGAPKPYTRASSAAKAIENQFGLEQWKRRNVAYGLAHDASLIARVLAVGGTPYTWGKDEKKSVNDIITAAEQVAQAHKGADIGTALHRLTERLDLGEEVHAGPYEGDLTAYRQALAAGGFTILPEFVEVRMVCDDLQMAGTADRIVRGPDGRHYIADLKTGGTVEYGGLGYSAQLAAYANGELYDPATDTRLDTPPLDLERGLIIHLPAGTGTCTLYWVDLAHGYVAAQIANAVRKAQKESKGWLVRCETAEVLVAEPADVITGAVTILGARLKTIVQAGVTNVAWPIDIPTFKNGGPRTWAEVKQVERAIDQAAAAASLPFDNDGRFPADCPAGVADLTGCPPGDGPGEARDSGPETTAARRLTDDEVAPLVDLIRTLPLDLRADVVRILAEQGIPGHRERWTVDHLPTVSAALQTAASTAAGRRQQVDRLFVGPDDELRPLFLGLAGAADPEHHDPHLLTELEVESLAALVHATAVGPLQLVVDQDGAMSVVCGEGELVSALGSKSAVVAAAKQIAETRGLTKPRSAADVAADPVLAALAWTNHQCDMHKTKGTQP